MKSVLFIKETSGPQNQRVQKVMPQRSAGLFTHCTRANAFPDLCRQDSADIYSLFDGVHFDIDFHVLRPH